jgi:hypothetical protein
MSGALVVALGALRRLLLPVPLLLAVGAGVLAGLLVRGLPEPELAVEAFPLLATALGALVVLPLAAGWICAERQRGYEQLVAVRNLRSVGWALGRMAGSVAGAGTLLLLVFATARIVGGGVLVPELVDGVRVDDSQGDVEWRFPLPVGRPGPYELQLETLASRAGRHELTLELRRGGVPLVLEKLTVAGRRVRLSVPDLAPARGDLFVRLRPGPGLSLDNRAPRLEVGRVPLGHEGLPRPTGALERLLVALIAAVAAASAFHFETACLAALLALAIQPSGEPLVLGGALGFLVAFAAVGTALSRRAAMP